MYQKLNMFFRLRNSSSCRRSSGSSRPFETAQII